MCVNNFKMLYTRSHRYHGRVRRCKGLLSGSAQILGSTAVGVMKAVESKLKETGAIPIRDGDDVRQSDVTTAQQTMKRKLAEVDTRP